MKKFFLSAVVIVGFIAYAAFLRLFKEVNDVAVKPVLTPTPSVSPLISPTVVPTSLPGAPTSIPQTTIPVQPTSALRSASGYKDGTYVGDAADAFYGFIQVKITIRSGRIEDVNFLQYPNDRATSIDINQQADPILAQEAIQAQSANVDIVSGATDSSQAFIQSMQSALNKAKG